MLPGPCGGAVWSILLWSAVSCPYPMLREAHRNRFSPALEVASSGLGEQPSSPLRVKTEVAALRRDVYFSLPTGVIQLEVACGRFETRRPVEPAGRTGNGAYLTRDEHQTAIPGGRRHLRHVRRAAPLRCGANYRMKGTIRVLAHLFCVNSKGHLRNLDLLPMRHPSAQRRR